MRLDFESNIASLPFTENGLSDDSAVNSQTKELLREGVKAAQAGNRATARTLLVRVTEIEPRNENAWLWLASISEYPEELVFFLNNVLEINPHNERALEWMAATKSLLAKTLVQRGIDASKENRLDFSKQCFEQALTQDEKNEMAWLWLASIVDSEEEKRAHLKKLLSINQANEAAQNALQSLNLQAAQKLLQTAKQSAAAGDRQKAAAVLAEVLETTPGLADAWLLKAHLTDSFDEKIKCFKRVLEINPEHQAAETALASLQSLMEFTEPQINFENTPAPQIKSEAPAEPAAEERVKAEEASFDEENPVAEDSTVEMIAEPEQPATEMPAIEENLISAEELEAATAQTEEFSYTEEYFYHEHQAPETSEELPEAETGFAAETEGTLPEAVFQAEPFNQSAADYQPEVQTAETFDGRSEISAGETAPEDDETEFSVMSAEEFTAGQESEDEDNSASDQKYKSFEPENNDAVNLNGYATGFDEVEETAGQSVIDPYRIATDFNPDENYQAEVVEDKQNQPAKEAEYFAYSEPAEDFTFDEPISEEPISEASPETFFEPMLHETKPAVEMKECAFCSSPNEAQAFACRDCRATLSLSDLEMLLGNEQVDKVRLQQIVSRMEMDKNMRGFNAAELTNLGIGHINLKNLRQGFAYLQESAQMNPNNVMLASQVNALAIRLAEIEQKEEEEDGKPKGKTILVIDDSATVRKLISGKLEKSGHEVVCAVDGMDALAKLNEVVPDLILLDITMPRMDGYQVCKLIRNNPLTKNIPVVMISGKDGFSDKVRGRMAGTTGYITKPFGPETLMKALEMYISDNNEAEVAF